MMDMVHLSKQTKEIQMEVAKIINEGQAQTYKRAFILANLKLNQNIWTEDKTKLKDECGIPKSIMEFSRNKNKLNDICSLVSRDEELKLHEKLDYLELIRFRITPCCQSIVDGLLNIFPTKEI